MTEPVLYPIGYGTDLVTIDVLIRRELSGMEPEVARRWIVFFVANRGLLGPGDGWRPTPSNTSAASMRGESFHQTQTYADGTKWFVALDCVRRNPTPGGKHLAPLTGQIPVQGSAAAKRWGIHANVGTPGQKGWESWHGQDVETDGWQTWVNAGRKRPIQGYPTPDIPLPDPTPTPLPEVRAVLERFEAINPVRFFDTRGLGGEVPAGQYAVTAPGVTGRKGVKVGVKILGPDAPGYATVWTGDVPAPGVSSHDFVTDQTTNTIIDVPLAADGTFKVYVSAKCGIIVDLYGYWT